MCDAPPAAKYHPVVKPLAEQLFKSEVVAIYIPTDQIPAYTHPFCATPPDYGPYRSFSRF